jgi:CelD/BcsL family acetyltransferase involved in cellulose biosynthesis
MFAEKQRYGVCLKSLEFIGAPNNDYSDFIYRETSVLDVLWKHVNESASTVDLVYLQQVKAASPTAAYLKADRSLTSRPCSLGLSAKLPDTNAPVEQYLKGPGLRKRTLRRIEKEGQVALRVYDSTGAIEENLPILFEQHISRWHGTPTPSLFRRDAVTQLYRNWASRLTPNVMLCVLTLNGAPVACLFGFPYGQKFIAHTLTYSTQHRQLHCGLYCIFKTMQTLKQRGLEYIDFTRGNEAYKAYFADIETLSYEFIRPQTLKAKCSVPLYLTVKNFIASHAWAGPLGQRLGFRPDELAPEKAERAQRTGGEVKVA